MTPSRDVIEWRVSRVYSRYEHRGRVWLSGVHNVHGFLFNPDPLGGSGGVREQPGGLVHGNWDTVPSTKV